MDKQQVKSRATSRQKAAVVLKARFIKELDGAFKKKFGREMVTVLDVTRGYVSRPLNGDNFSRAEAMWIAAFIQGYTRCWSILQGD